MMDVIRSVDAYHDQYVSERVNKIQREGGNVTKIKREERMTFGIFGYDVTHIHYDKKDK